MPTPTIYVTYLSDFTPEKMIQKLTPFFQEQSKKDFLYKLLEKNFEMIEAMLLSIKQCDPEAKIILILDKGIPLPNSFKDLKIEVFYFQRHTDYLMPERLKAYQEVLRQRLSENYLFLDWDILFQKNINHIFEGDFDLFFTKREMNKKKNYPFMPINVGVFGAKLANFERIDSFFYLWIQTIETMSPKYKTWFGDQLSLFKLIINNPFNEGKILLLPESIYNNHEIIDLEQLNDDTSSLEFRCLHDSSILHFKGSKKCLLLPYWNFYIKNK